MHEWHKALMHAAVPPLITKWEPLLGVRVAGYFLQRMKIKWGSCNAYKGHIRLNTELVKKPKDLLEYIGVHEMAHLIEPTHSERFLTILDMHYPAWREARLLIKHKVVWMKQVNRVGLQRLFRKVFYIVCDNRIGSASNCSCENMPIIGVRQI